MKKRILSLALASCLCLSLFTVPASASETLDQMPDVFQGDGVYVTAKKLSLPEGWTVYGGVPRGIHEGFVTVFRTEDIQNEDGFYTGGKRHLVNWVDLEGNLFDFSDWENPPILHTYNENHTQYFNFHDGMCHFYDGENFGYIDSSGNKVNGAFPHLMDFYNGYILNATSDTLIDKNGEVAFSLDELGWEGRIEGEYSDGLLAYRGYIDPDRNTYFVGWLNLQGEPVITLYSGDWSDYDSDEGLSFGTTTFSEGYAFVIDHRGGGSYPDYILIDTQGNEILTLEPEAPVYISGISGGEDYTKSAPGKVQGGRFWVHYTDTTPGIDYVKTGIEVLMDVEGNELFRYYRPAEQQITGNFTNGVAVNGMLGSIQALVIDINKNAVVPQFSVGEGSGGGFAITIGFNEDNQTLGVLSGRNGAPDTYYIMEVHQGTYTGPGVVYDAATGAIRDGGTTPVDPEPAGDQPSSWAAEQVNAAIAAGLVPEALQAGYTSTATRAQFCALAVELYETVTGSEIAQRAEFTDTTDVNVQKMAGIGVINGVGNGQFNPSGQLTREQAATILVRLADAMGHPLPEGTASFADNASIASWAIEAVGRAQAGGLMGGIGNNQFSPQGSYTREQSILTILRLYETVQ